MQLCIKLINCSVADYYTKEETVNRRLCSLVFIVFSQSPQCADGLSLLKTNLLDYWISFQKAADVCAPPPANRKKKAEHFKPHLARGTLASQLRVPVEDNQSMKLMLHIDSVTVNSTLTYGC